MAGAIDVTLAAVTVIGLGGAVAAYRRFTGRTEWSPSHLGYPRAVRVATPLLELALRHTRSPGSRATGIRRTRPAAARRSHCAPPSPALG